MEIAFIGFFMLLESFFIFLFFEDIVKLYHLKTNKQRN